MANLTREKSNQYQLNAQDLLDNPLFETILKEMNRIASLKIYQKSLNIDDIFWGKICLYYTDILRKKVRDLAGGNVAKARDEGRM